MSEFKIPETKKRPAPRSAFKPGQSGNPGGRPKALRGVIEAARQHTEAAVSTLAAICEDTAAPPAARVAASTALLDRGWGRPLQPTQIEAAVDVTTRADEARLAEAVEHLTEAEREAAIKALRLAGLRLPGEAEPAQ